MTIRFAHSEGQHGRVGRVHAYEHRTSTSPFGGWPSLCGHAWMGLGFGKRERKFVTCKFCLRILDRMEVSR